MKKKPNKFFWFSAFAIALLSLTCIDKLAFVLLSREREREEKKVIQEEGKNNNR